MILDIQIFRDTPNLPQDATITPVVFPLIVGAGSMTTLLSIRSQFADINILSAIVANIVVVYLVLMSAKKFEKILDPGLIYILQKLFGIILLAISVKLFMTNLSSFFQNLNV
jgi:multiple antibiotic resistance protein